MEEKLKYTPERQLIQVPEEIVVGQDWGRADLHLHTRDAGTNIEAFFQKAKELDFQIIAITEHDNNGNFDLIWRLGQNYGVGVLAGAEITVFTPNPAHLLIYFPHKSCVPQNQRTYDQYFARGVSARTAIEGIHEMGGICILPHPRSALTFSFGLRSLAELHRQRSKNFFTDGIEVLNPTLAGYVALGGAKELFKKGGFGGAVGGSDGRLPDQLGTCRTRFSGRTIEDLIKALRTDQTVAEGTFYTLDKTLEVAKKQAETIIYRAGEMLQFVGGKQNGD